MSLKAIFDNENGHKNRKEANAGNRMKDFFSFIAKLFLNNKVIHFYIRI